jgi:hypothetical protein
LKKKSNQPGRIQRRNSTKKSRPTQEASLIKKIDKRSVLIRLSSKPKRNRRRMSRDRSILDVPATTEKNNENRQIVSFSIKGESAAKFYDAWKPISAANLPANFTPKMAVTKFLPKI